MPEPYRLLTAEELAERRRKRRTAHARWDRYGDEYVSRTYTSADMPASPKEDPTAVPVEPGRAHQASTTRRVETWEVAKAQGARQVRDRMLDRMVGWFRASPMGLAYARQWFKVRAPGSGLSDGEIDDLILRRFIQEQVEASTRRVWQRLGLERPVEVNIGNTPESPAGHGGSAVRPAPSPTPTGGHGGGGSGAGSDVGSV